MAPLFLFVVLLGVGNACDMACWNSCVKTCESQCDSSDDCQGFNLAYHASSNAHSQWWCFFSECNNTVNWNDEMYFKNSTGVYTPLPGKALVCKGPKPPVPNFACPMPNVTNCKPKDWARKRHSALWLPGIKPNETNELITSLRKHTKAFDTISPNWAYMNSKWNVKCDNATDGLCGRQYDPDVLPVVNFAKSVGWRIVPILQVCGVCVLNGTWDWVPAMKVLVEDAKKNGFSGYILDMELGGYWNQSGRASFLSTFGDLIHAALGSDSEIDWYSHWDWWPDLSMPNTADYLFTMDTYRDTNSHYSDYWMNAFQCQAGIGLEYPGTGTVAEQQTWFKSLVTDTRFRSIGMWGSVTLADDERSRAWWNFLESFLAADYRA